MLTPITGSSRPCSTMRAATWAWWCCTATLSLLRQRERVLGRQVLRMQVVGDDLRLEPEELLVDRDAGLEVLQRLEVLEVADVLAQEGVGVAREAEGVLELGAAGEHLRERPRQGHRERGVAARPAHQPRPPAAHQRDGVVVARGDLAVVHQVRVGDRRQPVDLLPALDDRLLGEVAAGHDQRPPGRAQQQDVQRRVRQHRAEVPLAGRDLGVDRRAGVGSARRRRRDAAAPSAPPSARPPRSAPTSPDGPISRQSSSTIGCSGESEQLRLGCVHARSARAAARGRRTSPPAACAGAACAP